jgi:hypothetical protein
METENKRGLNSKDSGNEDENKRIEKEIAIARSKTSDKIMIMLKDHSLIEVSEFVEYLNANLIPGEYLNRTTGMDSGQSHIQYALRGGEKEKNTAERQLRKCYASRRKRNK